MDQLIISGSLKFVDILSHVQPGTDTLRPLLDLVQTFINDASTTTAHVLVVFDGISTLEWLGFTTTEVGRLTRALSSLCRKVLFDVPPFLGMNSNLVIPSLPPHFSLGTTSSTAS